MVMSVCVAILGLEEFCEQYVKHFLAQGVTGKQLLCLSHSDLEKCSVTKVGHQETIMEGLECLIHLVSDFFLYQDKTENVF